MTGKTIKRPNGVVFIMEIETKSPRRFFVNHQGGDGGWGSARLYRRAEANAAAAVLAEYLGAELEL